MPETMTRHAAPATRAPSSTTTQTSAWTPLQDTLGGALEWLTGAHRPTPAGPPVVDFDVADFTRRLPTAARAWFVSTGQGSPTFGRRASGLGPLLDLLESGAAFTSRAYVADLEALVRGLDPATHDRFRGPLRDLERAIASAKEQLGKNDHEVDELSALRRDAFAARLAAPAPFTEMTEAQRAAIAHYKRPEGFHEVNSGLRGLSPFSRSAALQATNMLDGLRTLPAYEHTVYRGAGCLIGGVNRPAVGEIYRDAAFLSTSAQRMGISPGGYVIAIEPRGGFVDISGIRDEHDATMVALAEAEDEVLGLPQVALRYEGLQAGIHRYVEVPSPTRTDA